LSFGGPVRDSRDLPDEPHTKRGERAMNHLLKTTIRCCVVSVLVGCASWTLAAPGPGADHGVSATVVNNPGDSILGDGSPYVESTEGVDARIWDFAVTDHLHFQVNKKFGGRTLRLVIAEQPGLPAGGVNVECRVGRLKPNESPINFQFYNDPTFPVGDSTSGPENYGGTFKCTTDTSGKTGWFIHWKPSEECIVISHPAADAYTFTALTGCPADVSRIVNGAVKPPLGAYDVPFQVETTVLAP
jgi:hypothetical protein